MIQKSGNINPGRDWQLAVQALESELELIGQELVATAVEYLNSRKINVNGDIQKSIYTTVKNELDTIKLQFGANSDHAVFVHDGTKPHWVPIAPLEKWARKKLNVPVAEAKNVAFAVARKIAKKGTKAKPFLAVAIRAHIQGIEKRVLSILGKSFES
jgi:hypothetical protein